MSGSLVRRALRCALSVLSVGVVLTADAAGTGVQWAGSETTVVAREGTNFALTASPKRDRMVIDLQGVLWSLPMAGGEGTRLTDDFFEAVHPDWSPDGRHIVVATFFGGMSHLWTVAADGSQREQLTTGPFDDFEPRWSPDGASIAFTSDRGGNRDIWIYQVATRTLKPASGKPQAAAPAPGGFPGGGKSEPNWSSDGKSIVYVDGSRIDAIDIATGAVRTLVPAGQGRINAPSLSPDGKRVSFVSNGRITVVDLATPTQAREVADFDDAFPYPAEWLSNDELLYTANGRIHRTKLGGETREVPFTVKLTVRRNAYRRKAYDFDSTAEHAVQGIAGPAISPDGRTVVFKALNDLWLLPVGGKASKLTQDSFYETDPVWSRDGKQLAYASDKAGTTDVYVRDVKTGVEKRVTQGAGAEIAPAWSPDGTRLAFLDEKPEPSFFFLRDLCIVDIASGKVDRILTNVGSPGRPSWSADGQSIAFAGSSDSRNLIAVVNVASRKVQYHEPAANRSISTRGDDGPMWSPDGKQLAFSMGSTLWVMPVAADGTPSGAARQVTAQVSDAPSWAGDSRHLLYLSNGQLRLLDTQQGAAREIATHLTYKQEVPRGRTVIHVGKLWDGVNAQPRENVDITVRDNRIESIAAHDPARAKARGVRFIDASGLTATPGLFDMHYHQQVSLKSYGDRGGRLSLAYGVTATRSTGDPVYRAAEDRESLASGARIGPRYFITGEMLDGQRLSWDFARPVESAEQLPLEFSRAQAMGYDLLKAYSNLGFDLQAQIAQWGQNTLGVSTTSHYLYPGVAHGVDGQEHLGGPTRWGQFSHMRSKRSYQDVVDMVTKSHIQETTSIFQGMALIANNPAVVEDARARALLSAADQVALRGKATCLAGKGPCGFPPFTPDKAAAKAAADEFAQLIKGGAVVMVGTDAPLDIPALSVHSNLRALALSMTPFEALQTATINCARAQGVEKDLGSIEVGKLADLVFVSGNPATNLDDLINVRQVMKGGRLYTIEELIAPYVSHAAP